jgi:hypothetical protein
LPAEQDQRWWHEFGETIERQRHATVAAYSMLGVSP